MTMSFSFFCINSCSLLAFLGACFYGNYGANECNFMFKGFTLSALNYSFHHVFIYVFFLGPPEKLVMLNWTILIAFKLITKYLKFEKMTQDTDYITIQFFKYFYSIFFAKHPKMAIKFKPQF